MEWAGLLCGLAVGVLACTALAGRIGVPAPFLLIGVGMAASFAPGVPQVYLGADVVLFGLLPPLLYAAAQQTSLVDFNANRRPILLLSIGLVVFTTLGVGVVVHALLPDLGWAVALALGAVVAPPDAVAATAIGRRIGMPRRVVTILEGESLFNDATALVSLRTALAVAAGSGLDAWGVTGDFVLAAGGGAAVGGLFYVVVATVRRRVTDPVLDGGVSLVVPFAAYVVAEQIHGSGVIAVVVAGLLLGHRAPVLQTAQSRIAERLNWRTISFVLENTVFLLIGLQAWRVIEGARASEVPGGRIVLVCVATLAAVIVLRLVWVFAARYLLVRPTRDPATGQAPPWSYTFLIGWAGMRGVVTLAAVFVIPEGTRHREILLLIAFTVVAGTLFVQGTTLPWFSRWMRVPGPDPAEDALARATLLQQATKAALVELDRVEHDDRHGVLDLIRQRVEERNFAAWERLGTVSEREAPSELYARARRAMIGAERRRVLEIRDTGMVPAEVVAEVLAMLDVEESMLEVATEQRRELRGDRGRVAGVAAEEDASAAAGTPRPTRSGRLAGETCEDLTARPSMVTAAEPVCQDCLDEGLVWVALRQCLDCGHVGCCDSSPARHATEHFHRTGHPVMQSAEPREDWRWCFVHHATG